MLPRSSTFPDRSRKELTAEGVSRAFKWDENSSSSSSHSSNEQMAAISMLCFPAHYSRWLSGLSSLGSRAGKGCARSKGHPFTPSVPAATSRGDKENEVLFFPVNTCLSSLSCLSLNPGDGWEDFSRSSWGCCTTKSQQKAEGSGTASSARVCLCGEK